jgi:hypothetical protein
VMQWAPCAVRRSRQVRPSMLQTVRFGHRTRFALFDALGVPRGTSHGPTARMERREALGGMPRAGGCGCVREVADLMLQACGAPGGAYAGHLAARADAGAGPDSGGFPRPSPSTDARTGLRCKGRGRRRRPPPGVTVESDFARVERALLHWPDCP